MAAQQMQQAALMEKAAPQGVKALSDQMLMAQQQQPVEEQPQE